LITSRNPVASALFSRSRVLQRGRDLDAVLKPHSLAILLVLVYVGAVMVLFPVRGDDAVHSTSTWLHR